MARHTVYPTWLALSALLAGGGTAFAQSPPALLPAPPASVCATPTVQTQPGDVHMFPGRWWNPKRNGTGWDFFYNDGQNRMYLTWFTFDQHGRPIWLHGEAADVVFNAVTGERTWRSRLHAARWNRNGMRQLSEVGLVSVTFPNLTTTRAAVTWQWDRNQPGGDPIMAVGSTVYNECLLDTYRDPASSVAKAVPELHQAHSSNWFYESVPEHPLHGWGVDLLIDLHPATGRYIETATAAIFDNANRPTWLQSVDDWGTTPPPGSTLDNSASGQLRYIRHRLPSGGHPATLECEVKRPVDAADKCVHSVYDVHLVGTTATNYFQREIDTARAGKMRVKADVPEATIRSSGGPLDAAAIAWPPADNATPFPATIPVMHFDSNHIIVDKSICRVAQPTAQCAFKISWIAESAGAEVRRVDLRDGGTVGPPLATGPGGQFDQNLAVGDRFQYELSYTPTGFSTILKLRTPEVRVLLAEEIADQIVVPADCNSGPNCDLGAHDPSAGAIAGTADVDGGAASYTIPIVVPPGRAGMQPQLALAYSSRAGNGIAGLGWSLSGLSSIHRCPRTAAQDPKSKPVMLDAGDALCLDGQRLVATSGAYGSSGAKYRTEIDSFARITQVGGNLVGTAACFKVEDKSGRISHYGGVVVEGSTPNSRNCTTPFGLARVNPVGAGATLSWQIAKTEDRVAATGGNNIAYRYRTTAANGDQLGAGELAIDQIHYTGFGAGIGTREVKFGYEARIDNDRSSSWLAGGLVEQTQRLSTITTKDGSGSNTTYTLHYAEMSGAESTSLHSGRSNLQRVEMCASGSGGAGCLQPTTVQWTDTPPDHAFRAFDFASVLPPAVTPANNMNEARRIVPVGDLDGDGSRELVVIQNQADGAFHNWLVKYTADRQFQQAVELPLLGNNPNISHITPQADLDGDGRVDLVNPGSTSLLSFHVWNGDRGAGIAGKTQATLFRAITTNVPWQPKDEVVATEDVDGDGHIDIVALKVGSNCTGNGGRIDAPRTLCLFSNLTKHALAAGDTTYNFQPGVAIRTLQPGVKRFQSAADVNGDGISEIFIGELTDPGTQFPIQERLGYLLVSQPSDVDPVVGSGCVATGSARYHECTAPSLNLKTSANAVSYGTFDDAGAVPFWTDVNGDGLTDLLFATPFSCVKETTAESMWCIQLSTGKGFTDPIKVTGGHEALTLRPRASNLLAYANRLVLHDANTDGKAEVLYPAALAARICLRLEANYPKNSDEECPIPAASGCNPGLANGVLNHLDRCQAKVMLCGDDPSGQFALPTQADETYSAICGQYSYDASILSGIDTATDFSAYTMKGLRFEQTGAQAFRAVSIDVASGTTANRKVVAQSGTSPAYSIDAFGDGLADLVTTLGCGYSPTGTTPCVAYTNGTDGPAALPDGTPVASLMPNAADPSAGRKLFVSENVGALQVQNSAPVLPELVRVIRNGMGITHDWLYAPLSSKANRTENVLPLYEIVPTQASYADAKHFYFQSTMPVVSTLTSTNGVAALGFRTWRYGYREAMYNHLGRGFQGFRAITKEQLAFAADVPRIQRTTTTFHQKFPLTGRIEQVETGKPKGLRDISPHTRETFTWACAIAGRGACDTVNGAAPTNFPYVLEQTTTSYDATAAEGDPNSPVAVAQVDVHNYDATETAAGYDEYGNATFAETIAQDFSTPGNALGRFVESKRTTEANEFEPHDVDNWWIDRLEKNIKTEYAVDYGASHELPADASTGQHIVETVYAWNTNRTQQSIHVQPDAGDTQSLKTEFEYALGYGLPTAVKRTGKPTDSQPAGVRITSTTYDTQGYFPTSVTEVLDTGNLTGLTTTVNHRAKDGQVMSTTSPLGVTSISEYDPFGRLVRTRVENRFGAPMAQPVAVAWNRCTSGLCTNRVGHGGKRSNDSAAEAAASYTVTTVQNGSPTKVAWFDALDREIKTATRGHDGTFSVGLVEYDAMGTIARQSVPFYLTDANASAPANTVFTYDRAGRVTKKRLETKPGVPLIDPTGGNLVTEYSYSGNRTEIFVHGASILDCALPNTGAESRCMRMQRYAGVLGMMRTVDAQGGVTRYWSDAAGRPVAIADVKANADAGANVTAPGGIVNAGRSTRATYDALGRRTQSIDPNQGSWSFVYNPFGELRRQTDARGAITTVANRDPLGRLLAQTMHRTGTSTPVGFTRNAIRDEWTYDTLGRLYQTRRCRELHYSGAALGACASNDAVWSQTHDYDDAGRVTSTTTSQLVLNQHRTSDVTRYFYDANFGREKAIAYPSGLRVQNVFTRHGTLLDVLDADTGERFWGVDAMDAFGNVTRQTYGNGMRGEYAYSPVSGQSLTRQWRSAMFEPAPIEDAISYTYDSFGNLKSQTRDGSGTGGTAMTETYGYDSLQRLLSATVGTSATQYAYDAAGNFTRKSDFSKSNGYLYSTTPVRGCGPNVAHTVQPVDNTADVIYSCDANGNIVESGLNRGDYRTIDYDIGNRPIRVVQPNAPADPEAVFAYSPTGDRAYEELVEWYTPVGGGVRQSRTQVVLRGPRGYEVEQRRDSALANQWDNAVRRHELGEVSVVMSRKRNGNGTGQGDEFSVSYKATDRLGSPLGLMSDTGSFTRGSGGTTASTRRSFDAFGKTRESNFAARPVPTDTPPGQLNLLPETRNGFTGHEHLDNVGLIHMNGRAYDYQLGRFVSVDPFVQFPANSQSLNPYSYILNNPLAGTDPTGYQVKSLLKGTWLGATCSLGLESGCQGMREAAESSDPADLSTSKYALMAVMNTVEVRVAEDKAAPIMSAVATFSAALTLEGIASLPVESNGAADQSGESQTTSTPDDIGTLEKRAKELHSLLDPQAQRRRTTAVVEGEDPETGETRRFVGSSNNRLAPVQRAALQPNEAEAKGKGHAEATAIRSASEAGLKDKRVGASRRVCEGCQKDSKESNTRIESPLKPVRQRTDRPSGTEEVEVCVVTGRLGGCQ